VLAAWLARRQEAFVEYLELEVWITVKRTPTEQGAREHYSVFKRLMIGGHKL